MISRVEEYVLVGVRELGPDGQAYGASLAEWLKGRTGGKYQSLGSIYTTLQRLEQQGFVESWYQETNAPGQRAKRCFRVTGLGEKCLQEVRQTVMSVWQSEWGTI